MVQRAHARFLHWLVPGQEGDGAYDPLPEQERIVWSAVEGGRAAALALSQAPSNLSRTVNKETRKPIPEPHYLVFLTSFQISIFPQI